MKSYDHVEMLWVKVAVFQDVAKTNNLRVTVWEFERLNKLLRHGSALRKLAKS